MKILIIEDEPLARTELKRLLKLSGREFEILEELDTVSDSIDWLSSHSHPDLVFLDIQLADGISFEIFRNVKLRSPVIFTTAYDEYAVRAFQLNSIDYLLKPIKPEALEKALTKLDELNRASAPASSWMTEEKLERLLNLGRPEYKSRILLKLGDVLKTASISDISYFYSEDNVVFAIMKDKSRFIVDYTLNDLEGLLDPAGFHRITRNCLAGIASVKKVSKYFNSRLAVELDPPAPEQLLVSRVKVAAFLEWMDR
jgi:DNA-binding LytR/AlgR family response regulator